MKCVNHKNVSAGAASDVGELTGRLSFLKVWKVTSEEISIAWLYLHDKYRKVL